MSGEGSPQTSVGTDHGRDSSFAASVMGPKSNAAVRGNGCAVGEGAELFSSHALAVVPPVSGSRHKIPPTNHQSVAGRTQRAMAGLAAHAFSDFILLSIV